MCESDGAHPSVEREGKYYSDALQRYKLSGGEGEEEEKRLKMFRTDGEVQKKEKAGKERREEK